MCGSLCSNCVKDYIRYAFGMCHMNYMGSINFFLAINETVLFSVLFDDIQRGLILMLKRSEFTSAKRRERSRDNLKKTYKYYNLNLVEMKLFGFDRSRCIRQKLSI